MSLICINYRSPLTCKPIRVVLVVFVIPYLRIVYPFVFGNLLVRSNSFFYLNSKYDKSEALHKVTVGADAQILIGVRHIVSGMVQCA